MTASISLAVALVGGFPFGYSSDGCPSCGGHGGIWKARIYSLSRSHEYFIGSWYTYPELNGSCSERFHVAPAPHQGYYYFHSYNYRNLSQHAQDAAAFGDDPQMPYGNELFRRRYRQKPEATPDALTDPDATPIEPKPMRPHSATPTYLPLPPRDNPSTLGPTTY